MKMQLVPNSHGLTNSLETGGNRKERVALLQERAASLRGMARDILAMADEAEAEAAGLVGRGRDDDAGDEDAGNARRGSQHRTRLAEIARGEYRRRRMRERYFDKKLFGEPAWDMLLELYASELNDEKISTSNLILSSSAPSSTALRWIKHLEDSGLVSKTSSHLDGRVQYQSITNCGFEAMTNYFKAGSPVQRCDR